MYIYKVRGVPMSEGGDKMGDERNRIKSGAAGGGNERGSEGMKMPPAHPLAGIHLDNSSTAGDFGAPSNRTTLVTFTL